MRTVFDSAKVILDGETTYLCLAVPPKDARKFVSDMKQGKKYAAEPKEHRERRSLNANDYMWQLLDKLAFVLDTTKEELYLGYVRRYGIFKDFHLEEGQHETFRKAWQMLGVGWPTELVDYDGDKYVVRAYYGSSQYNTRQMSRLINAVVEDCKEQDIETLTPCELARLMDEKT